MKKFWKVSKMFVAMVLVAALTLTMGGNFAFAASSRERGNTSACADEAQAVVEAVSKMTFYSVAPIIGLDADYWTRGSDIRYDPSFGTQVATFKLSNYAKIARLLNLLWFVNQIPGELYRLEVHNGSEFLKKIVFEGRQKQPIWNYLSTTTRAQITGMDAEHALKHIKRRPEYTQNKNLHNYVDWYLEDTLSDKYLRAGLKAIFPTYSFAIDRWNLQGVLDFARCAINTPQYNRLIASMEVFYGCHYDAPSLAKRFTYDQAKTYELGLSLAASYYLPDEVKAIETFSITLPATMLSSGGEDTNVGPEDQVPVPSVPAAVSRDPKYYR